MKIEDFRPIRSQDSAPIKFDWLLTQESDWIIWTNQKITLIIFWLVKNGKDWNPAIPLVKRIFLVPDHIWPKTIKGQPALTHVIRNYLLLLVVPPLCLWWVTHSDESAQAQNSSRATTTLVSQPPHSTYGYKFMSTCEIALRWTPQNTFDNESALVQVNGLVPSGLCLKWWWCAVKHICIPRHHRVKCNTCIHSFYAKVKEKYTWNVVNFCLKSDVTMVLLIYRVL